MALGATRGGIVRLVLGEIAALLLLGIPLGLATLAAARLVRSMLLDLTPPIRYYRGGHRRPVDHRRPGRIFPARPAAPPEPVPSPPYAKSSA
jgi:hypothetical protein